MLKKTVRDLHETVVRPQAGKLKRTPRSEAGKFSATGAQTGETHYVDPWVVAEEILPIY